MSFVVAAFKCRAIDDLLAVSPRVEQLDVSLPFTGQHQMIRCTACMHSSTFNCQGMWWLINWPSFPALVPWQGLLACAAVIVYTLDVYDMHNYDEFYLYSYGRPSPTCPLPIEYSPKHVNW